MTYRDNVDLAATALVRGEDANWELARLTFENTKDNRWDADGVLMAAWCADVREASGRKFGEATGAVYKAIWRRYGLEVPPGDRLSWADAYREVKPSIREEGAESPSPPRERPRTYDQLADTVYEAPPEHREYLFRRLAGDPEITMQAAEIGSPVSAAVSSLAQRAEIYRARRREQRMQADPVERQLDQGEASASLMVVCDQYARQRPLDESRGLQLEASAPWIPPPPRTDS